MREALRVLGRRLHEPERQALRGLRPDAGQPRQLVDQVLDRALVHGASLLDRRGAEHLLDPAERLGLVGRVLVLVDDAATWRAAGGLARLAHDAHDRRARSRTGP